MDKEKLVNSILDEVETLENFIKNYEKLKARKKQWILDYISIWKAKLLKIIFEELKN